MDEARSAFRGYKKFTEKFNTSIGIRQTIYYK